MERYRRQIDDFVKAAHLVEHYKLVRCSSGNMSCRCDDGQVLVSASGSWLGMLERQQVAICELKTGKSLNGVRPSVEINIHTGILSGRDDVNVVLHFQSPFAAAVACSSVIEYDFEVIIEVPLYIGRPAVVGYNPPGSDELAGQVVAAAQSHDMVILKNHGMVTVGTDYRAAIEKAAFFELACQILLTNPDAGPLGHDQIKHLGKLIRG